MQKRVSSDVHSLQSYPLKQASFPQQARPPLKRAKKKKKKDGIACVQRSTHRYSTRRTYACSSPRFRFAEQHRKHYQAWRQPCVYRDGPTPSLPPTPQTHTSKTWNHSMKPSQICLEFVARPTRIYAYRASMMSEYFCAAGPRLSLRVGVSSPPGDHKNNVQQEQKKKTYRGG